VETYGGADGILSTEHQIQQMSIMAHELRNENLLSLKREPVSQLASEKSTARAMSKWKKSMANPQLSP